MTGGAIRDGRKDKYATRLHGSDSRIMSLKYELKLTPVAYKHGGKYKLNRPHSHSP